jgi:methylase of polypeptide subunit release factors
VGTENAQRRLNEIRSLKTPYDLTFMDVPIRVFDHVYPTGALSELVVEYIDRVGIGDKSKVLDYGTGTGFLAIQAAKRGAKVVATDMNPFAIECAKYNARINEVRSSIDFRMGKSFEPIKENEKFDVITAGMPWDQEEVSDYLESALYDPEFEMRRSLFQNGKKVLNDKGYILMTYADFMQERHPIENFISGYKHQIVNSREKDGYKELVIKIYPV